MKRPTETAARQKQAAYQAADGCSGQAVAEEMGVGFQALAEDQEGEENKCPSSPRINPA